MDSQRIFQLSGIPAISPHVSFSTLDSASKILTSPYLSDDCTHVIADRMVKTEKILSGLARGLWILHSDYLKQSLKAGTWLQESEFDISVYPKRNPKVPLKKSRDAMFKKGRFFLGKIAMVLLSNDKRVGYEKILYAGGAKILPWTLQHLPSRNDLTKCDLIFSEPEILDHPILGSWINQLKLSKIYSFLYISMVLTRMETEIPLDKFEIRLEEIRMFHTKAPLKSPLKKVSMDRNASIVLAPDDLSLGLNKRKRKPSRDIATFFEKKIRTEEPSPSSPMKILVRRNSVNNHQSLGDIAPPRNLSPTEKAEKKNQVLARRSSSSADLALAISKKGALRHFSIYKADLKPSAPLIAQECVLEENRVLETEEVFFHKVLESHIHCDYQDPMGNAEMWLWSVDFLKSSLNRGKCPSYKTCNVLLHQGILNQTNSSVIDSVSSYFFLLIEYILPPTTFQASEFYLRWMNRNDQSKMILSKKLSDPYEPQLFLSSILDKCKEYKDSPDYGARMVLKLITRILEINFSYWVERSEAFLTEEDNEFRFPLIARIFFPTNGETVALNSASKNILVENFVQTLLQHNSESSVKELGTIFATFSQFLNVKDKQKNQNFLKEELVDSVWSSFQQNSSSNESFDERFFLKISSLHPSWLSLMLSLRMINKPEVRTDQMISLRKILEQISAKNPDYNLISESSGSEKENRNKVGKILPVKNVNKTNHHGETLLHTACKKGNLERIANILATPDVDVNAKDYNQWTALHEACAKGDIKCVEKLLRYNPNRNSKNKRVVDVLAAGGDEKITALHEIVNENNLKLAKSFLDILRERPDVFPPIQKVLEAKTNEGKTVCDLANSEEMKKLLNSAVAAIRNNSDSIFDFFQPLTLEPIDLNANTKFGIFNVLRKYCSEFSLHYVRQTLKSSANNNKNRRFRDDIDFENCWYPDSISYSWVRSEPVSAKDFKTFVSIVKKEPDLELAEEMKKLLKIFTILR